MAGQKKSGRKNYAVLIFVIGLLMVAYPVVSAFVEQLYQNKTVNTYEMAIKAVDKSDITTARKQAEEYNRILYQSEGIVASDRNTEILNEESYKSILDLSGNGVMGSLEIPKIDVSLPVYHGTSEDVLNAGCGHLRQSSFPVGGINTRAILTGHRGLPDAKLFTRLDELVEGDFFFLRVLDEILAYKVCDIEVIEPDNIEVLKIKEGQDLVTLLTCHPYGINSHRLLVTGERTEYNKEAYEAIDGKMMSTRELIFVALPFLFGGMGAAIFIKNRKRR